MSEILDLILKNESEAKDVIRLVASENLPGVEERLPFMLDMYARYSFDDDSVWKYPTYYLSYIERMNKWKGKEAALPKKYTHYYELTCHEKNGKQIL